MEDENYDLLPHKLLADLKDDVESLRKKMNQPDTKINELILEIESMKDSVNDLNTIFEKALEQTKDADPYQTIKVLAERVETVLTQNETIAKGMVAISDKVEEWMKTQNKTIERPMPQSAQASQPRTTAISQHSMGPPQMPGDRFAPMPQMEHYGGPNIDIPPPPPGSNKKKTVGGLFK